jgi:general secretion pathway protein C
VVRLWDVKTGGKPGATPARPMASVGPAPAAGDAYSKGVKKTGQYEFQIDKGMLEENLADLGKIGLQARIVPNYEDGKYHGFRLVGIRPDSLYRAIGLESGDLIKRVNGRDLDSPNKAIELFEQLRSSANISLDVDRRGQKVQMQYQIK